MIHEHQFQRQHRTAPRHHFSGGHVGHGRLEPLVEAPSFKREAAVVIPAIVVVGALFVAVVF